MASMVEALGIGMPDNAAIPAVDSRRACLRIWPVGASSISCADDVKIAHILTRQAFENAIRVNGAIGGSTNAVLHLIAIARRVGVDLSLDDWDRLGRGVPTIVDLMPSGRFLMEDFYYAGGLLRSWPSLDGVGLLHRDALTVNGRTIGERSPTRPTTTPRSSGRWSRSADPGGRHRHPARQSCARRRRDQAVGGNAGVDAAPRQGGGVRKHRTFLRPHRRPRPRYRRDFGHGAEELRSARVSRHAGGRQHAAAHQTAEARRLGHGAYLRRPDERNRYGTVVLHVAPEAASGGVLALVRDGDIIELDVAGRRLELMVSDAELASRRAAWRPPEAPVGGYQSLYVEKVLQADSGCDFDFLVGRRDAGVPRHSH